MQTQQIQTERERKANANWTRQLQSFTRHLTRATLLIKKTKNHVLVRFVLCMKALNIFEVGIVVKRLHKVSQHLMTVGKLGLKGEGGGEGGGEGEERGGG